MIWFIFFVHSYGAQYTPIVAYKKLLTFTIDGSATFCKHSIIVDLIFLFIPFKQ